MFGFNRQQVTILHLSWIAFFLTFVSWFNLAPFNTTLIATMGLTEGQMRVLMIANVALTIPARILIGPLVDALGPKRVFVGVLLFTGGVCFLFAMSRTFNDLLVSRLLMGMSGAGFVVGIKMIAEWFPREKMGTAQGLYAGWGNFGAAAAAFTLPLLASFYSPDMGWRAAATLCGACCLLWAAVYHSFARDVPDNTNGFELGLDHAIEVTSYRDLVLQILIMIPVFTALGLLVFKLATPPAEWLSPRAFWATIFVLSGLFAWNAVSCVRYNAGIIGTELGPERRYAFKQIAILSLVYALTFGSELAVVSMFPEFLEQTFALPAVVAGVLGSCFAFFNLVTRPLGGGLADRFGRRRVLFFLVAGSGICYWIMGGMDADWPVVLAVGMAVLCSVMIQAGNGACFAMIPLVRRDLTGQLAGVAGAYGNVGAVMFLTVLSFVSVSVFFYVIAGYALLVTLSLAFLDPFDKPHPSFNRNRGV